MSHVSRGASECHLMDGGFVKVEDYLGNEYCVACFAMVCHHCGAFYVEFFSNARQENLLIGMVHAFMLMGTPEFVLTDNVKSVILRRYCEGRPLWQTDCAAFMACVGFSDRSHPAFGQGGTPLLSTTQPQLTKVEFLAKGVSPCQHGTALYASLP